eukprot:364858-Chlamydomonas_euryale.AAC.4
MDALMLDRASVGRRRRRQLPRSRLPAPRRRARVAGRPLAVKSRTRRSEVCWRRLNISERGNGLGAGRSNNGLLICNRRLGTVVDADASVCRGWMVPFAVAMPGPDDAVCRG